jgi:hypothetical protein
MLPAAPVCAELLKTEERYVCDLRDLVKYFVVPLRRAADRVDPVVSESVVRPLSRLGYHACRVHHRVGACCHGRYDASFTRRTGGMPAALGEYAFRVSPASPGINASSQ